MKIVALTPDHIMAVQLQRAQAYAQPLVGAQHAQDLAAAKGVAWSALDGADVIACAGLIEMHAQRAVAWAMFSDAALRQFKTIHRVAAGVIMASPWRRIEMTVDAQHRAAITWAERLGFEREGLMAAYTPDGRDCFLYSRVK